MTTANPPPPELPPEDRTPLAPRPAPPRARPERRGGLFAALVRFAARLMGVVAGLGVLAVLAALVVLYGAYRHYAADLPDIAGLKTYEPPVMSRVFAADGSLIAELASERRIFAPFDAIPPVVRDAFVAAEDQNFWIHRGIDPLAILRAAITDLSHLHDNRRPVGASTITQQLAKNMLLGNERTLSRKIREAILAMRIEQSLSKERILELYLNEIYLGQQAYGVAAAAETYFAKPLSQITLAEAATLAALPKAPTNYNPFLHPDAAKARRDWVLERMAETHAITLAEARAAQAEPLLPSSAHRPEPDPDTAYFADEVRKRLIAQFGEATATEGGLLVDATLDPRLQRVADRVLREGLIAYDRKHGGWRGPVQHLDLDPASLRDGWPRLLATLTPPRGMLPAWRLAVVLEVGPASARLGWLERNAQGEGTALTGTLELARLAWARPVVNGGLGPVPRRMRDVLAPGDVVMIEPEPGPKGTIRLELRQIPEVEGALVSLDPRTGRVLALSGGFSHAISQFDRATEANRQPGSSFKPFVYLTAMERGISPSQRFLDAPFVVDLGAQGKWRPNNYEMDFNGPMPLHEALEHSRNLVTLRVADLIGMDAIAKTAADFGIVQDMPRVLPAALGAVETTVLRLAGAYASLAEGGRVVTPTLIDVVKDRHGHVLWRSDQVQCTACAADPSVKPLLADPRPEAADAPSVFQVVTMMEDVVARGTGVKAGAGLNRPIAGKTGTTQDFTDAWFAGFTPDLVTVVWIGFDQPASLGHNQTGGELAAPIWHDFMAEALTGHPVLPFVPPPGVTLASWSDGTQTMTDAFKDGQTPGASLPLDALIALVKGGGVAAAGTPAPATPADGATTPNVAASGAAAEGTAAGAALAQPPAAAPAPTEGSDLDKAVGGLY
jgi:penicillin-binding protein 1A